MKRILSIPEKHQLKIAKDTLKMSDMMVGAMGGITKEEAKETIRRIEDKMNCPLSVPAREVLEVYEQFKKRR